MRYENPQVPHDVNVARGSQLLEFLRLAAGVALVLGAAAAALYFAGGQLARVIPFSMEKNWVGERVIGIESAKPAATDGTGDARQLNDYLQRLTTDLAAGMELPDGMTVRAHYSALDVPNAFATLGGHIVITRKLYELMPSENALAMVIAHEIAHVKHRDPIAALGGAASLALLLALISGDANSLGPELAMLVQRGYSRDAERRADGAAIAALRSYYGHAGGAEAVFEQLSATRAGERFSAPTLLATHPADAERIARLKNAAQGWEAASEPLRPLAVPIESIEKRDDAG